MPPPVPPRWAVLLTHHGPHELHRCLSLSFGQARLQICARCTGMVPAMALAASARLAGLSLPRGDAASVVEISLPIFGGLLWAVDHGGGKLLPNWVRVAAGASLGGGLGWILGEHLQRPWPQELLVVTAALTVIVAAGLLWRRAHREEKEWDRSALPPPETMAERLDGSSGIQEDLEKETPSAPER